MGETLHALVDVWNPSGFGPHTRISEQGRERGRWVETASSDFGKYYDLMIWLSDNARDGWPPEHHDNPFSVRDRALCEQRRHIDPVVLQAFPHEASNPIHAFIAYVGMLNARVPARILFYRR